MVELILLACERVVLRDRNTLHSSSLARSAALELSELLTAFIVERIFFFFYMEIKLQDYCGFPSLLTSTGFFALCSHLAQVPCSGHRAGRPSFFQSPFLQLLRERSRCSQLGGGRLIPMHIAGAEGAGTC